jgi:hypothetical protein
MGQETDKATIDVEAQEDGVMGKIIVRCTRIHRERMAQALTPRPRRAAPRSQSDRSSPCSQRKGMICRA